MRIKVRPSSRALSVGRIFVPLDGISRNPAAVAVSSHIRPQDPVSFRHGAENGGAGAVTEENAGVAVFKV